MKAIKRRISSVSSTQQIMKAMNLVAASKLQKAKAQLDVIRPLYDNVKDVMDGVCSGEGAADSVYFQKREVKKAAYLIITGDRGLCGGYNTNICKDAYAFIKNNAGVEEKIIIIGNKGNDYFRRRRLNVIKRYNTCAETVTFDDAQRISEHLIGMYTSGDVDEVYVTYTHFTSILSHDPKTIKVLPLGGSETDKSKTAGGYMTYDPDVQTFMEYAVPMYLKTIIYGAFAESGVCEQASRMTSMDAASRNAEEIIDDLTLVYNRKRQGAITQEITEIVSGANAIQ
jgi:F-type H+-transporting ATPase subunit gamma